MWYTMLRKAVAAAFAFGAVLAHAEYPDPERYRAAIEAFLASEADAPPPKNAVVATGSSSMRFWHRRIGEDLAPLTIIPRGFGGSNMRDVRHFLDELVLRHEPRAVLLYEGDNDAAVGATPEQVLEHFDAIVATIHERLPATRIYALSVKPSVAAGICATSWGPSTPNSPPVPRPIRSSPISTSPRPCWAKTDSQRSTFSWPTCCT